MATDIRVCNICIQRSPDERMHLCTGCMRFICTRAACMDKHRSRCTRELEPPTLSRPEINQNAPAAAGAAYSINGFDVEFYKSAAERKGVR
jgi:hypothetical protein